MTTRHVLVCGIIGVGVLAAAAPSNACEPVQYDPAPYVVANIQVSTDSGETWRTPPVTVCVRQQALFRAANAAGTGPAPQTDYDTRVSDGAVLPDVSITYTWDSGAGSGTSYSRSWDTPGQYTVTLTAEDVGWRLANDPQQSDQAAVTVFAPVLRMLTPPENQTSAYVGETSGTGASRSFYKAFLVGTQPTTDGLSVTVHMDGESKPAPGSGSGTYLTSNWDITEKRSPQTVYATAPNAQQSGNATLHFKKNRQLATCAPDYQGCPYVSGANGPDAFDCSGLQYYLYRFVGYNYADNTAQGMYNSSTHIAPGDRLPGDWIFFDWHHSPPQGNSIDHTGVFVGNNQMVHASSGAGKVVKVELTDYYNNHALYGHRYGANERF